MPLKSGRSSKSIKKSGGQIMPSYFDSKSTKPKSTKKKRYSKGRTVKSEHTIARGSGAARPQKFRKDG